MEKVLTGAGHKIQSKTTALEGLALLEERQDPVFSLVISSYRMPVMGGDQILEQAKLTSPLTQRMIITNPVEIETVIGAVNRAGVHACMAVPFADEDFLLQVNLCLDAHAMEMKRANLIRVTERQNRQMYKLAKNFKNREELFATQIKVKAKQLRVEQSRLKAGFRPTTPITLEEFFRSETVPFSPASFALAFQNLSNIALTLLNNAGAEAGITIEPMAYDSVRIASPTSRPEESLAQFFVLLCAEAAGQEGSSSGDSANDSGDQVSADPLDKYIEFTVSDDGVTAFASLKKSNPEVVTVEAIKQGLENLGVRFGIKEDSMIETWLSAAASGAEPFVIAQGRAPVLSVDASVVYHFQTDFLHAGEVKSDGSIDFRKRGDIPFVTQGSLLAERTCPVQGNPGMDVSGALIPVADPADRILRAGQGASLSEDGLKIYADCDGQPHLDPLGNVSVLAELIIKGDVDFETGNINFKGNIVVGGVIKEGFSVRGTNLTAGQIEGANIKLTGDLNVRGGIIDAKLVRVQGSVQARYVNNSFIRAFGDLMVQKEIIDSTVLLSGECHNLNGNIISSTIIARNGVKAVTIGTETSPPSRIRVGVDDHIKSLEAEVDAKRQAILAQVDGLNIMIAALETEDQALHMRISDAAHIQDRSQVELGKIEGLMDTLEGSRNFKALEGLSKKIKGLHRAAQKAEISLEKAFQRQDVIVGKIQEGRDKISLAEDKVKALAEEKNALVAFSKRTGVLAQVIIGKKAVAETIIEGPNTMMQLKNTLSRSRVAEVKREGDDQGGLPFFEMVVSPL